MAVKNLVQGYGYTLLFKERIDSRIKNEILKALPLSIHIWNNVVSEIRKVEQDSCMPFWLNESKKPYALDAVLITKALGFDATEHIGIFELFTLYYLEVHLIDDLIEDQQKFYSKFLGSPLLHTDQFKAVTPTFTFSFSMAAMNIMHRRGMVNATGYEVMQLMTNSLLHQVAYFAKEKNKLSPEEVLEAKERRVSGNATSFMADLLGTSFEISSQKLSAIKDSLFYLGSLTQFTDDLRDMQKDYNIGNANLILSLKDKFGSGAMSEFHRLYNMEETFMLSALSDSGITADTALLKAIPWHPFITKDMLK